MKQGSGNVAVLVTWALIECTLCARCCATCTPRIVCSVLIKTLKAKSLYYGMYLFPGVAITKYHTFSGLKQQKFILSCFWRPEVWNKSVSRARLLTRLQRRVLSGLSQFLMAPGIPCLVAASLRPLPLSSCGLFLCVSLSVPLLLWDTSHCM